MVKMANVGKVCKIFISFSFLDEKFAVALADYFKKIIGESNFKLYCAAFKNNYNSTKYGSDFAEDFISNVNDCDIFIPLLSLNYKKSISSILELGAAISSKKTITPLILPGCDYSDFNDIYNLRNRDYYSIEDSEGLKKLFNLLSKKIKIENAADIKIEQFIKSIDEIKQGYIANILDISSFYFSCDMYKTYEDYKRFVDKLKKTNLLECSVMIVHNDIVKLCNFHLQKGHFLPDFKKFVESDLKLQNFHISVID